MNNALEKDMNPEKITEKINQFFCYSGYIDKKYGTMYVDLTRRFPIRSLKGNVAIFVLFDYIINAFLV